MSLRRAATSSSTAGSGTAIAIVVFVALLIGAIWIFALEIVHRDREETISAAIDRNDNLAIAFEQFTTRTIESADDIIGYMIRDYLRSGSKFDIDRFAADHTINNKSITDLVLADENANIASTAYLGKPAKPVNVADREHFKVHLTQNSGKLFVGKPVIGRVSGKLVIPITRRINKPDGSFGGVAIVMIEHSRFTDVLQDAKMREFDIISLIGFDGITRARLRGTTPTAGEDIRKSPLFAEQARNPVGNYAAHGQVDGVKRIFSYRSLPEYQLIATIGAAEANVLARFHSRRQQYFWTAGVASVWIAGFAFLLILLLEKQRRTAASVARSQARFLATFNQAAVGITHTDIDGRFIEVNQKFCDIVGYSREELLGRRFSEITHPDDISANNIARRKITSNPDEIHSPLLEKRYIRKDGTVVWCQLSITGVRDDAGNIDYLAAIAQDISQRKAAEQALKLLEHEQRLLAEQAEAERARLAEAQAVAKMGSWETRFPDLAVAWSAETHRIFETDAASYQPTHQRFMAFIHPDDHAIVDAAFSSSLEDRLPHTIQHRIVLPDGRIKIVEERWHIFVDDQGQPARAVGTCQDITDKKRAEQDRAQLAAIVESSTDAIISRTPDRTIISWNRAAELMFGWTADEAIGQSVRIITPPEQTALLEPLVERVMQGEIVAPVDTWRMRRDGSRFEAQIAFSAINDSNGKIFAIATIIRDITERREKEAVVLKEKLFSDAMIESMPGIVYFYDEQGRFLRWNRNFSRVSGYSPEEIAVMHPLDFFRNEEKPLLARKIREVFVRGDASVEADLLAKDGRATQYFFTGKRVMFDGSACLVGMGIDIHDRKLAEAAVRDYAAQMRHLSWRLSEVEERERRDIHRELHDQVGANLSALNLDLGLINNMLVADGQKTVSDRLLKTRQMLGETIAQIRDVMANLRPPALDDYGLLAALRNQAQPYAERLGITVSVDGDDIQPRLAIAVETALFRIAQEALANIAKHAHAQNVSITVKTTAVRVTLLVADDGSGFDTKGPRQSTWGLRTMRERAQAIDADFRIDSSPGRGTRIRVELKRETA